MCQVTPFTLPCCRRIYVEVLRLPSCPDGWPKKKCPKELCLQISGYEPKDVDHRNTGTCWRCVAMLRGKSVQGREELRPVLDKAFIVEGLDEIPMDERRRKMKKAGICWFCGACEGCKSCGSGPGKRIEEEPVEVVVDRKGKGRLAEAEMVQRRNKKAKFEHDGGSMPTLTSENSGSSSKVPDLSVYPAQPFERQPPTTALQYDHNLGGFVFGQFNEPAPAFNYRSQEMRFQNPVPQNSIGGWQGVQGFPLDEHEGSVQIDPALEQPQASVVSYNLSDYTLSDDSLPPVPDVGSAPVSNPSSLILAGLMVTRLNWNSTKWMTKPSHVFWQKTTAMNPWIPKDSWRRKQKAQISRFRTQHNLACLRSLYTQLRNPPEQANLSSFLNTTTPNPVEDI